MIIYKLKTLGVAGGLLAGLALGAALAAVFSAAPLAMAQSPPVTVRPAAAHFQIAAWAHPSGAGPASHGAYILDTMSGKVWEVVESNAPKSLGGVE